ncbi:type II toxin-antitoxin system VapC family toxin [Acidihalobacter ferrooxydans]|uniref:VapC toxin family PIN domain ribonuclease n=1 Tax=Acidihalobacter ferrooxydans TaxID=1765967 RepID=A0A1P8UFB1_9GAMM|nr:type II toxin-antitoxin system VapC family toxin [Acidihalobacter ferrooxydans]APZ42498.1 VapC toxin family PIN domain ribonuclease [Acidihalobacter ferrooxydans]
MNFVLDASVALLWLAPQANPTGLEYATSTLSALKQSPAVVPSLFALEVANVIARLEFKEVVTEAESQRYIAVLERLNITVDPATAAQALSDTLNLARRYKLSSYDAAYLELSLRAGLPLATLDASLEKAAIAAGVAIFGALGSNQRA